MSGGEDARGCISPEIMPTVEKMCFFLNKLLTKCGNGHVKIGDLQWLQQRSNKDRFVEVASEAGHDPQLNIRNLQLRFKELEEFEKQAMDVCCALRHCGTFIQTSKFVRIDVCVCVCVCVCVSVGVQFSC